MALRAYVDNAAQRPDGTWSCACHSQIKLRRGKIHLLWNKRGPYTTADRLIVLIDVADHSLLTDVKRITDVEFTDISKGRFLASLDRLPTSRERQMLDDAGVDSTKATLTECLGNLARARTRIR